MSAFIVSHDHIDALMTFAIEHRVSYYVPQHLCNVPGGTRVDIRTGGPRDDHPAGAGGPRH